MDFDLLVADTPACPHLFQLPSEKEMGDFGRHAGGCGGNDQFLDFSGVVAGFLDQLAAGGLGQRLSAVLGLIADNPGRQLDRALLDRDSMLLDQYQVVLRGDCQDSDRVIRVRTADKVPVAVALELEPAGFEEGFNHWSKNQ